MNRDFCFAACACKRGCATPAPLRIPYACWRNSACSRRATLWVCPHSIVLAAHAATEHAVGSTEGSMSMAAYATGCGTFVTMGFLQHACGLGSAYCHAAILLLLCAQECQVRRCVMTHVHTYHRMGCVPMSSCSECVSMLFQWRLCLKQVWRVWLPAACCWRVRISRMRSICMFSGYRPARGHV